MSSQKHEFLETWVPNIELKTRTSLKYIDIKEYNIIDFFELRAWEGKSKKNIRLIWWLFHKGRLEFQRIWFCFSKRIISRKRRKKRKRYLLTSWIGRHLCSAPTWHGQALKNKKSGQATQKSCMTIVIVIINHWLYVQKWLITYLRYWQWSQFQQE